MSVRIKKKVITSYIHYRVLKRYAARHNWLKNFNLKKSECLERSRSYPCFHRTSINHWRSVANTAWANDPQPPATERVVAGEGCSWHWHVLDVAFLMTTICWWQQTDKQTQEIKGWLTDCCYKTIREGKTKSLCYGTFDLFDWLVKI